MSNIASALACAFLLRARRAALALFLLPYVLVNAVFTALAAAHPLGARGTAIVAMKFWMGFSGLAWAYPIAGFWMRRDATGGPAPALPERVSPGAIVTGALALAAALLLALGGVLLARGGGAPS